MNKGIETMKEVELIRGELEKCIANKGDLLDPEVIEVSRKLDKLIIAIMSSKRK